MSSTVDYQLFNNSPVTGSIAWTKVDIVYDGVSYAVADGHTDKKFVYWLKSSPNVFQAADELPALTEDDCIALLNRNGVVVNVLNSTALEGDLVVPGTITSLGIATNAITANHIKTDAIQARHILAGQITAEKLVIDKLSAISGNMGSLYSGNITIDQAGFIQGGATTYSTGNGFWEGYHNGYYKWRVGQPGAAGASWDGKQFTIYGADGSAIFVAGDPNGSPNGNGQEGTINLGDGVNLLYNTARKNPGGNDNGWTPVSGSANGWSDGYAFGYDMDGSVSLSVTERSRTLSVPKNGYASWNTSTQTVNVEAGASYEFSAYVGCFSATSAISIDWLDGTGAKISTDTVGMPSTTGVTSSQTTAATLVSNSKNANGAIASLLAYTDPAVYYTQAVNEFTGRPSPDNSSYYSSNFYHQIVTEVSDVVRVGIGVKGGNITSVDVYSFDGIYLGKTAPNSVEASVKIDTRISQNYDIFVGFFLGDKPVYIRQLPPSSESFGPLFQNVRFVVDGNPIALPIDQTRKCFLSVISATGKHLLVVSAPNSASAGSGSGDTWHIFEYDDSTKSFSVHSTGSVNTGEYFSGYYSLSGSSPLATSGCIAFESDLKSLWIVANNSNITPYMCYIGADSVMRRIAISSTNAINNAYSYPLRAPLGTLPTSSCWADGGLCIIVGGGLFNVFADKRRLNNPISIVKRTTNAVPAGGTTASDFLRIGGVKTAPIGAKKAVVSISASHSETQTSSIIPSYYILDDTNKFKLYIVGYMDISNGFYGDVTQYPSRIIISGDTSALIARTNDVEATVVIKPSGSSDAYMDFSEFQLGTAYGKFRVGFKGTYYEHSVPVASNVETTLNVKRIGTTITFTVNGVENTFTAASVADLSTSNATWAIGNNYGKLFIKSASYKIAGQTVFAFSASSKKVKNTYWKLSNYSFDLTGKNYIYNPTGYYNLSSLILTPDNRIFYKSSVYTYFIPYVSTLYQFGTDAFEVNFSFSPTATPAGECWLVSFKNSSSVKFGIAYQANGKLAWRYNSTVILEAPVSIALNTRYDVNVSRTGSTLKFKINGTTYTATDSTNYPSTNSQECAFGQDSTYYYRGYFWNFFVKKAGTKLISIAEEENNAVEYTVPGAPYNNTYLDTLGAAPTLDDATSRHIVSFVDTTVVAGGIRLSGNASGINIGNNISDFAVQKSDSAEFSFEFTMNSVPCFLFSALDVSGQGWGVYINQNLQPVMIIDHVEYVFEGSGFTSGVRYVLSIEKSGTAYLLKRDGVEYAFKQIDTGLTVPVSQVWFGNSGALTSGVPRLNGVLHRMYAVSPQSSIVFDLDLRKYYVDGVTGKVVWTRAFLGKASASQKSLSAWMEGSAPAISTDNPLTPDNIDSFVDPSTWDALVRITNENRNRRLALKVIGGAYIDDLAVDTLHIKGQAVTVPTAYTGASVHITQGNTAAQEQDVISTPAIDLQGGGAILTFSCTLKYGQMDAQGVFDIYINGVFYREVKFGFKTNGADTEWGIPASVALAIPAGAYNTPIVVTIKAYATQEFNGNWADYYVNDPMIAYMGAKR